MHYYSHMFIYIYICHHVYMYMCVYICHQYICMTCHQTHQLVTLQGRGGPVLQPRWDEILFAGAVAAAPLIFSPTKAASADLGFCRFLQEALRYETPAQRLHSWRMHPLVRSQRVSWS